MYKEVSDWLAKTGQRVLAEGGDVTDAMKKRCPFFYVIDPIMCNHASIKLLALSEEMDWENISLNTEQMTENNDDSTYNPDTDTGVDSHNDAEVNPLSII
jgi:hypothetical protein